MEVQTLNDYISVFENKKSEDYKRYLSKSAQPNLINKDIIVSGDVHGDLTVLLTILDELSGSIEINQSKLAEFYKKKFKTLKEAIDYIPNIPVNWKSSTNNCIIVFCGDTIDNRRSKIYDASLVFDEEIKIVLTMFKLQIDGLSKNQGNMIYKVIGNHELFNFTSPHELSNYFYDENIDTDEGKLDRIDYFRYEKRQTNFFYYISFYAFPIIMLANNVFLHGGLDKKFTITDETGEEIHISGYIQKGNPSYVIQFNKIVFEKIEEITSGFGSGDNMYSPSQHSPFWTRIYSNQLNIQLPENFDRIFVPEFRNNNIRIFVGHCPNVFYQNYPEIRKDWRNYIVRNGKKTVSDKHPYKKIYTVKSDKDTEFGKESIEYPLKMPKQIRDLQKHEDDPLDRTFGISMNIINKNNNVKLFRLDVASAYSFDAPLPRDNHFEKLKRALMILYARKPQVVKIYTDKSQVELHKIKTSYFYPKYDKSYFRVRRQFFNGEYYSDLVEKIDNHIRNNNK